MDPSRHHDFIGSNEERSRANAAAAYYGREIPDIAAHHYYGSTVAATAAPPPPPTRGLSNSRNPCDCTTTPSGARITCNGCRLNPPADMWQPRATSTSNSLSEQHTQRGDYRQMVNETSMRTAMRPGPMFMQQQHQQPPPQQQQQHQPPPPQPSQSHGPPHQSMVQSHATHVGNRSNYWPQNPSSTSQHYGDEHMTGPSHPQNQPTSQTQIDISITRRSAAPVGPVEGSMYGQYKSASITATATHPSHSSSSYPPPSSSTNFTHQRVSAIGGPSGPVAAAGGGGSSHYMKERIYSTTTTTKIAYNTTTSSAIYDSHPHHMNNQALSNKSSSLPIDHHVINPSNLPASKEQHPSPNYARKCPQMYTPEAEQSTAHHHNLYMPTPQFSSDKFSRASPQQMPPDYTKLRESPLQSSAGSPYMSVSGDKYNHLPTPTHLRESPQFVSQQPSVSRNSNSYYAANQNPSKVHPPEMSPIIMTQSHTHYQYSKSPLPPPLPPSAAAATHQLHQIPPAPNMGAKMNSSSVLAPPPPGNPPSSQRYIVENVKREDLEIYETNHPPMQQQSSRNAGSGIYINPYNTPPPTGDSCCKDVAPLSASSSPYTTGSATPNYRVESPQFYPTKYGKMSMTESNKHSLINQNTPPPSRAPSQRGHQQPAYYYESNPHSAPSPAAATAASPSPSSLLPSTTTTSQNQIHHSEYITTLQQGGPIGPPPPGHTLPQSYPTQPTAQHQSTTASLRNNELIVGPQNNASPYERIIPHPHPHTQTQPPTKHPALQQTTSMQMQAAAHHASKIPATAATNKQKPNYRELINRTLAMRNATSEEELNRQIIKKTLNVDTQNKRGNAPSSQTSMVNARPPAAVVHQQSPNVNERLPLVREPIRPEITAGQTPSKASMGSVLVNHHTTAASLLPRTETSRICIKQEDDKQSSSTTASSPLDLSMRTVKTKADSTEYKYQQKRRSTPSSNEGRYTLPRVDSTPVFSVHAFEPAVSAGMDVAAASRQISQNSRHNSLDRRNYTPPTPAAAIHPHSVSAPIQVPGTYPSPQSSTQHGNVAASQSPYTQRRTDLQSTGAPAKSSYETLCVIKTAPKPMAVVPIVNDRDVLRSTISQTRPSVLETNPYASVIKTEPKRLAADPLHTVPVKTQAPASSTQHTLAAVERLPPDTSIMPLPPRNAYTVQRALPGVPPVVSTGSSTTPPSYSLGCERNPNFRKRHIQEYSSQMSAGEPIVKQARYIDAPPVSAKPQLPMRPADISVIAVNESNQHELERCNKAKQQIDVVPVNTGVIASTVQPAKVIVNNHNCHSPSAVVVCKQEPLTPTAESMPPKPEIPMAVNQPHQPNTSHVASARIRTKAELKGFTFNPPPLTQTEIEPPPVVAIKQEEELTIKVKEEPESNLELPSIPGLEDNFAESNLLDCGWSNTCNNFVKQLRNRPVAKKNAAPAPVVLNKPVKDVDMVVSSTDMTCRKPLENHFSNMESADTTRSSFARLDGLESGMTLKSSMNQDTINSPTTSVIHKKLTKTEREKKRFQQEKRLAERLQAKESSSETEDELDKRKTERLKKPLMKSKNKLKTKSGGNSNENNSSSTQLTDKNRFSDCGSDSSSGTEGGEVPNSTTTTLPSPKKDSKNVKESERNLKTEKKNDDKCDKSFKDKMDDANHTTPTKAKEEEGESASKTKKSSPTKEEKAVSGKKPITPVKQETKKLTEESSSSSTESSDEEDEADDDEEGQQEPGKDGKPSSKSAENSTNKINNNASKGGGKFKVGLNTMTRSKLKKEMELQLANSKVLRNDKIIRNSTTKIKRKYVRKYVNNVNSYLESGGLSRESGIIKSTRLKAKLERKGGGALNLLKKDNNNKSNKLASSNNKDALLKNAKTENLHDRNDLELYRFKRALKVPPSLINIKHPGAHKIAASLPDLERHAEALDAYAKKKKKSNFKSINKQKNEKSAKAGAKVKTECVDVGEPRSIIDVLHSKVTKASGLNVRNISTSTTASKTSNKTCTISTPKSYSGNNCSIFSETSQTTESSELQMLPPLRQESEEEEDDDNESANGGKKRHFSIFDTTVLPTKTRTESKLQQKRENIREIFVGDDRPASAPPEMTQVPDIGGEKMTYEQKYEQFLQKMNIVISADKSGRFSRTAASRKLILPPTHQQTSAMNIKQEEVDTESTSVMDPDELKEDQKSECQVNQLRKKRGKYLRRKGSSGFDYIRKKKKPTPSTVSAAMHNHNSTNSSFHHVTIKSEKMEVDEYENKVKTEDDVSREIQKWVLNKGVGQSTMHKAARQGYMDVIVYCLDRMAMNPDQKDNAGYTPLHEACTNGWLDIARVLLQYGANHSAAAHSGIRPLHEASENDNEEIVRLLLSYGADPLLATYSGQTPLMLASSTTMRDILNNHLVDVQSMGPDRKPWRFNGPWEIYDASEWGYNVFEGAPNPLCDMSRALLRRGSLTNNQMLQNKKLQLQLQLRQQQQLQQIVLNTNHAAAASSNANTTTTTTANTANASNQISQNGPTSSSSSGGSGSCTTSSGTAAAAGSATVKGIEAQQTTTQQPKGETTTKTVMDKCAVVLDKIDRFNSVRLNNDNNNKPEILVENSDSDGEMFEFEEADVLLPPLYLLKDEGTNDKWVLLNDLCNLLKVKSKDTLLNKINPPSSSAASAHKSLMRELKMSDFLEKATCLQLLCAGEKLNICASKVVLIKYNEKVRNLLGVKTILMKF